MVNEKTDLIKNEEDILDFVKIVKISFFSEVVKIPFNPPPFPPFAGLYLLRRTSREKKIVSFN